MEKKRENGFTLAELLVVVAIIGVLVAVSIPIFTGQLEKARIATDKANVRAAKVAAAAEYLNAGATGEKTYYYDAADGVVESSKDGIKGYGKSGSDGTGASGIPVTGGTAHLVMVVVTDADGDAPYTASWVDADGSSTGGDTDGGDSSSIINRIKQSAGTWPTPGETKGIEVGKAYTLSDGTLYIAAFTHSFNQYDIAYNPTDSGYEWCGVKPSGTMISSDQVADGKLTVTVNYGDIYQDQDGNFYIWKTSSNSWGAPVNDGNWIKIVFS